MKPEVRHYEEEVVLKALPQEVFDFVDNHNNFSSHMDKGSWMMGGGKMETLLDEGGGKKVGSHIRMRGKVFGIDLFLDEVVTKREPPTKKEWETVGKLSLLVIDQYKMGFNIAGQNGGSRLRVYIDYGLPKTPITYILGVLFSPMYAKWCVKQMLNSAAKQLS